MSTKRLSKLNKIELRNIWGHEALDFTKWLALEENLEILSIEIGVQIKLIKTEASVGKFNVDILAEEEASGRKIIIENQLEDTDHDHLGKIITYASGYGAEVIIWLVKEVRKEHQKAIDWLNEHTDEDVNFFLLKIELWQIDDSNPAPKFEIVASPNEWSKAIKSNPTNVKLTDTKLQQLEFWRQFKEYVSHKDPQLNIGRSPRAQHWFDISIGNSVSHIALTIDTRKNLLGCELYIQKDKELFKYIKNHINEIEDELREKLDVIDAQVASSFKIRKSVKGIFDDPFVVENFMWLHEKTKLFKSVFSKYIDQYRGSK